ncbi:transposase [Streptomyces asiaticus]|uniref:transposase n=1 Tax=Streptomyces asiaticus TaxID=114695 RepID=UPI003F673306
MTQGGAGRRPRLLHRFITHVSRSSAAAPADSMSMLASRSAQKRTQRSPQTTSANFLRQRRELLTPCARVDSPRRPRRPSVATPSLASLLPRTRLLQPLASPLPIAWVTADALYGQDRHFRRMLEEAGLGYVVAVPKSQQIKSPAGCWRIDQLIRDAPDDAWERLSCGDGAKGPRIHDWAHITLAVLAHAFLAAVQAQAQDAEGATETDLSSSRSAWQRSAGSWRLAAPEQATTAKTPAMP